MNKLIRLSFLLLLIAITLARQSALAYTLVSGNVSGTWALGDSPYILTADTTVPSGQVLTIQPGVTVEIPASVNFTVNGLIAAIGSPSQEITFESPPGSGDYFAGLWLFYDGGTNIFHYCTFANCTNAIWMHIQSGNNEAMHSVFFNCTFTNIINTAIYAESTGTVYWNSTSDGYTYLTIENCIFANCTNGCIFNPFTQSALSGGVPQVWMYGRGHAIPTIKNCIFNHISNQALGFVQQTGRAIPAGSVSIFINNTVLNSQFGVFASDPFDVVIEDNIFESNVVAVTRSGILSATNYYNCFYADLTNFVGYPSTYGRTIIANANGTPCDIGFNIFQNPQFADGASFTLAQASPCANAGNPDEASENMCFPPSTGARYADIGVYGGPGAANWLDDVPLVQARSLSIAKTNHQYWLTWFGVPRSSYLVEYATNLVGTTSVIWRTNSMITTFDAPIAISVAEDSPTNQQCLYRIRSLGRLTGN